MVVEKILKQNQIKVMLAIRIQSIQLIRWLRVKTLFITPALWIPIALNIAAAQVIALNAEWI